MRLFTTLLCCAPFACTETVAGDCHGHDSGAVELNGVAVGGVHADRGDSVCDLLCDGSHELQSTR